MYGPALWSVFIPKEECSHTWQNRWPRASKHLLKSIRVSKTLARVFLRGQRDCRCEVKATVELWLISIIIWLPFLGRWKAPEWSWKVNSGQDRHNSELLWKGYLWQQEWCERNGQRNPSYPEALQQYAWKPKAWQLPQRIIVFVFISERCS